MDSIADVPGPRVSDQLLAERAQNVAHKISQPHKANSSEPRVQNWSLSTAYVLGMPSVGPLEAAWHDGFSPAQ